MATPGGALSAGFFGCFGVLGAGLALLLGLYVVGRIGPGLAPAAPEIGAAELAGDCRAGWAQLEARHRLRGRLREAAMPPVVIEAGRAPLIRCHAADDAGTIDFTVRYDCGGAGSCAFVTVAQRNGADLPVDNLD